MTAALGSFLDARAHNGSWVVRVEDIDPPREQVGASQLIIDQLHALGLESDERIQFQRDRVPSFHETLGQLTERGLVYPCACTRRELGSNRYPGTCRAGLKPGTRGRSLRVLTDAEPVNFSDRIHGDVSENIDECYGDFVLRRGDGLVAYHLAVTLDDAWQNITDIVRGADLMDSTGRHVYLQKLLGLPTPRYAHLPVAVTADQRKLSKQNGTRAIDTRQASGILHQALTFLGQQPPGELAHMTVQSILDWGIQHWTLQQVPKTKTLVTDAG